ncbi:homoserine/homoserine lactone efflux protein [Aidingimonas halophila]|uniref:Homoserine/homoserine lactone efflux protein n=1 Tax=Aidingimonas halophila TaxID=574349 RepID=A0A1H2X117_9GAMM|nr:homoserine/homoserine lactone efflux protein [Aidingimonas halophila]GHC27897.1 homoserine/homoserine lactone efflux protein [Aidingimonas halophila]SDW86194.1 homoserine/homoserine lactone efflux protein [Aidingimonas halophila]
MSPSLWLAFLLASILISLSPGAGAVNTMSNGLRYGVRHTMPTIAGLQLGYGLQILVVGVGLGAVLASSTWLFSLLKWAGVAYLIWLGWQKWREGSLEAPTDTNKTPDKRFWESALVNVTNPKATVFLVSLFPQFLVPGDAHGLQLLIMGVTLIAVDIIVMLGYATLASQLQRFMRRPGHQRMLNRLFGGLFMAAAVALASFRRQGV